MMNTAQTFGAKIVSPSSANRGKLGSTAGSDIFPGTKATEVLKNEVWDAENGGVSAASAGSQEDDDYDVGVGLQSVTQ